MQCLLSGGSTPRMTVHENDATCGSDVACDGRHVSHHDGSGAVLEYHNNGRECSHATCDRVSVHAYDHANGHVYDRVNDHENGRANDHDRVRGVSRACDVYGVPPRKRQLSTPSSSSWTAALMTATLLLMWPCRSVMPE